MNIKWFTLNTEIRSNLKVKLLKLLQRNFYHPNCVELTFDQFIDEKKKKKKKKKITQNRIFIVYLLRRFLREIQPFK